MPDVLGFGDYAADPGGTVQLVARRLADEAMFIDQQRFPLPKPSGGTAASP